MIFKFLFTRTKFLLKHILGRNEISMIQLKEQKLNHEISKGKVVIFIERYWPIHACWELSIGRILKEDGYDVIIVGCCGVNNFCDSYAFGDIKGKYCLDCTFSLKEITKKFGFQLISIKDFIRDSSHSSYIPSKSFKIIENELEDIVDCSFIRHLRSNNPIKEDFKIKDQLVNSASRINLFWDIFLDSNQFKFCFFLNGLFFNSAVLKRHCELRGIDYYTYERGNRKNTLVFSKNSNAVPIEMQYLWNQYLDINLSDSQIEETKAYLSKRVDLGNGHVSFFPKKEAPSNFGVGNYNSTSILYKRTYIMFTNLIWDSAVYSQDTIFENMYEWVSKTIDYFTKNSDLRLIIRVHPAEVRIDWWKTRYGVLDFINEHYNILPDNITIIGPDSPIDSYKLMDYADVGLFYTSTSGIEFGLKNKPVIVCGNSHYSFMDFVYLPQNLNQYYSLLDSNLSPKENQLENLIKYSYLFYFIRTVDVPFINETKTFQLMVDDFDQIDSVIKSRLLDVFK